MADRIAAWTVVGRMKAALAAAAAFAAAGLVPAGGAALSLERGFRSPPPSARPHVWYHMMNGNISKEGVTCDFEAMAAAGLGGLHLFDIGSDAPPGPVKFDSPEWFDVLRHVHKEAKRLGLEVCLRDSSGWSGSGGRWITPRRGMKNLVWSQSRVKVPAGGDAAFAVPARTKRDNGFYEDVALLAFPVPEKGAKISNLAAKTARIRNPAACRADRRDKSRFKPSQLVPAGAVVDLTLLAAKNAKGEFSAGKLDCRVLASRVPAATDWTVLRFGVAANGKMCHPVSLGAEGLEVDKLSAEAVQFHFDSYLKRVFLHLGLDKDRDRSRGVNAMLLDSYEVWCQNWTPGLEKEFERRTGGSLIPYLPVFAGFVVGSPQESEDALASFRRVVADMFAENYAGRLAALCREYGVKFVAEPYGNGFFDNLQYGKHADMPMGEFWNKACLGEHGKGGPGNSRFAASLAHVWGRRYAAAESFTSSPPDGGRWMATPFAIKSQCDRAYAEGVNRIVYHRFAHQPWPGLKYLPGMTMGRHGMHLDRTQTWWRLAPAWFLYQSRCQWMLQEGGYVADVLYLAGEESPNDGYGAAKVLDQHARLDPKRYVELPGHGWDVCSAEALIASRVAGGRVVVPGGVGYKAVVLPPGGVRCKATGKKLEELAAAGVAISPGKSALAGVLRKAGVAPDFVSSVPDTVWIHRRDGAADWYFVARDNATNETVVVSLRETGRLPELWDAETGLAAPAREWRRTAGAGGEPRTEVVLELPPSGSIFVVLRKPCAGDPPQPPPRPAVVERRAVSNLSWTVDFPVDWYSGGRTVKSIRMDALEDWTANADPDVKYFSGTATYKTKLALPRPADGEKLFIDLGDVKNFAEVKLGGRSHPALWRPPYRIDATAAAAEAAGGEVEIEIKATNLWPNRLVGDEIMFPDDSKWLVPPRGGVKEKLAIAEIPEWVERGERSPVGRHIFTVYKLWTKKDKLLPSGLLGPLTLERVGK